MKYFLLYVIGVFVFPLMQLINDKFIRVCLFITIGIVLSFIYWLADEKRKA